MGAWITYGLGSENQNLPGFIAMCPGGHPIVATQNWRSAFLPGAYQGTYLDTQHTAVEKLLENIHNNGLTPAEQRRQLDLVQRLNQRHLEQRHDDAQLETRIQSFELAYRMQSAAPEAIDISKETPETLALYGIDAANGAIVISTKRGKAGGGFTYSNSFRLESTRAKPEIQRVYGPTTIGTGGTFGSFQYFGAPYAPGTIFYDNIGGFLQTGATQTHNLAFSGATTDGKINYRFAASSDKQRGVVRNTDYGRVNLTGASQAQIKPWLNTDLTMAYTNANNDQVYKGDIGPLIGLLLWPQTDDAKDYLTPSGVRRRLTSQTSTLEVDVAPSLPAVMVDGDAVSTALLNLLDNALRHSAGAAQPPR
jgi:hypothetical protein